MSDDTPVVVDEFHTKQAALTVEKLRSIADHIEKDPSKHVAATVHHGGGPQQTNNITVTYLP